MTFYGVVKHRLTIPPTTDAIFHIRRWAKRVEVPARVLEEKANIELIITVKSLPQLLDIYMFSQCLSETIEFKNGEVSVCVILFTVTFEWSGHVRERVTVLNRSDEIHPYLAPAIKYRFEPPVTPKNGRDFFEALKKWASKITVPQSALMGRAYVDVQVKATSPEMYLILFACALALRFKNGIAGVVLDVDFDWTGKHTFEF